MMQCNAVVTDCSKMGGGGGGDVATDRAQAPATYCELGF